MKRINPYIFLLPVLVFFGAGCANRGVGPQGGPKDTIPPVPVKSVPEQGTLQFHDNRIEILFNEYIQLDNIASNLLMSPPQQNPPDVKARGKRLIVQFKDSLLDSTTYTIDFGSAVCDYHEKVPLNGFTFCFSTGDEIDTLHAVGKVYDAETLNPLSGILAGIHSDLEDSAFTSKPFLRIARTDSTGTFRIGNIHPGQYRLYAVEDISRDYRLTVGEPLAFADAPFAIYASDSLETYHQLLLFKEEQKRLYLQRTLREQRHMIVISFSSSPDSLPSFRAMRPSETDSARSDSAWVDPTPYMFAHYSPGGDTVTLWLTDSLAISQDSIFLEARYRRTDSLYRPEWCTDTLRAIFRAPRLSAKAKEAQERKNRNRRLELKSNARKGFELYDTLCLNCSTPLARVDSGAIRLYEKVDTVYKPVPLAFLPGDSLPLRLRWTAPMKAGEAYELRLDSGALHDIYGVTHVAAKYPLQLKTAQDYSTLRVKLVPFLPDARIQVLNGKDQVIRELPATEQGAFFEYLKPDTYYLRLYLDVDHNGRWTTGSWSNKRRPEPVYYYPGKIQTKSNWDFEEEWDYQAVEQLKAKPKELIKTNPKKK